jgi:hypothetical protein
MDGYFHDMLVVADSSDDVFPTAAPHPW